MARPTTMSVVREMAAAPDGFVAEESWPSEHPWMTFVLVILGLGTIAGIVEAVASKSTSSNAVAPPAAPPAPAPATTTGV